MDTEERTSHDSPEEATLSVGQPDTVTELQEIQAEVIAAPEQATIGEKLTATYAPSGGEDDAEYNKIEPRGAYAFVIALGVFYLGYWFITYFEIFVLRGS